MSVTILMPDSQQTATRAEPEGDNLWMPADELEASTGWELKPEGMCRDEVCVPIYGQGEALITERDGRTWVNFAGFARHLGQPVVHDGAGSAWSFGDSSAAQRARLQFLLAPDFELRDFEGRSHRLSDLRGHKVVLALWASW